jgi:hypothetical protein
MIYVNESSRFGRKNLINYLNDIISNIVYLNLRDENWIANTGSNADVFSHLVGKAHDLKKN